MTRKQDWGRTSERSYTTITRRDLRKLAELARADKEQFFARPMKSRVFRNREICTTLCQGAAVHYLDRQNGIKDFDVWTFFAALPGRNFPSRRKRQVDLGSSKFGRWGKEERYFEGRHVDLMWRALPVKRGADPAQAIQSYLTRPRGRTARLLAQKAVVVLEPEELVGTVVWPPS